MSDWTLWWAGMGLAGAALAVLGVLLARLARPRRHEFVAPSR